VPVRDALLDLVDELMPFAERLRCTKELIRVRDVLTVGPSYARQRAAAAASGGDLSAVVDSLLQEMRDDAPSNAAASS